MKNFIKNNQLFLLLSAANFILIYASSFNRAYGFFIDEWYYLSCAARPAFGYVDHPPLAPLVLTLFTGLFGKSLLAVRVLPALATSVTVFLTGKLTEEIGGGRYARHLAAIAMVCTPTALAFGGFYSMNVFEPLLAVLMLLISVRMVKTQNLRLWIPMGALMGLGMMNKHTYFVTIFALLIAMAAFGHWRLFLNRWFILGCGLAFLIFLPNIIWQVVNHFPSLEFYRNITEHKNVYTAPVAFIVGQILSMSPANVPLWFAGTLLLLFGNKHKAFRYLGGFFAITFLFMLLSHTSRSDRSLFAYPAAFAGGALYFESLFANIKFRPTAYILHTFMVAFIVIAIPLFLPYFSYQTVADYVQFTGFNTELEVGKKPPLPQLLADRIGWKEKVDLVHSIIGQVPEADRKDMIITTNNYGKAGALEYYADELGCNRIYCAHNSFYLWGKDNISGKCVVSLEDEHAIQGYRAAFDSVEVYRHGFTNPYVSSHENNLVVLVSRHEKRPLPELFAAGKFYY